MVRLDGNGLARTLTRLGCFFYAQWRMELFIAAQNTGLNNYRKRAAINRRCIFNERRFNPFPFFIAFLPAAALSCTARPSKVV